MPSHKRHILFKKIAAGGMAEIFLAKTVGTDGFQRPCCIKRILPHHAKNKNFIKMFRDEAHICKRLQHTNIVRIEDFEEIAGSYAIIMEYISGFDLRKLLYQCEKNKISLAVPIILYIIAESARGLDYAHNKKDDLSGKSLNIVHRDISPQNILISFDGEVKVSDFGIADMDNKLVKTSPGVLKGKFAYMSPEQLSGKKIDRRSDIFALSVVLWECLAMKRLFYSSSEVETIEQIKKGIIREDLRVINPNINEDLFAIIKKGLAREVQDRYQSCKDFEKNIRSYLNHHFPNFYPSDLTELIDSLFCEEKKKAEKNIKTLMSHKVRRQVVSEEKEVKPQKIFIREDKKQLQDSDISSLPPLPHLKKGVSVQKKERISFFKKNKYLIFFCILLTFLLTFFLYKASNFDLRIEAKPDRLKIKLNNKYLKKGRYIKTPVKLKNIDLFDEYNLTFFHTGYAKKNIKLNIGRFSEFFMNPVLNLSLDQVNKSLSSYIRISPSSSIKKVHVDLNKGLNKLIVTTRIIELSHIYLGESYELTVSLGSSSSENKFLCSFIPLKAYEGKRILLTIDTKKRTCSVSKI